MDQRPKRDVDEKSLKSWAADVIAGDQRALARAITWVENERQGSSVLLEQAYAKAGRAHRLGLTGPPGAGKSTLVTSLIREIRKRGESVGVVAVDPSSPFTGGALLGDRVRMQAVALEEGVFIRSMASRGCLGGLARRTIEVCDLIDAAGFDWILIETVGVGQTEVEIAGAADTVVLVLCPESGDGVQALKAGLMEIGDIYAVNKSDRPGADKLRRTLELMQELARQLEPRPVLSTQAFKGKGVPELLDAIRKRWERLAASGELQRRRRARLADRLMYSIRDHLEDRLFGEDGSLKLTELVDEVVGGATPQDVVARVVAGLIREAP